ncbi:MAG: 2-nitropropane dioxygenase [Alphaproteobacteria bacterium RIFCSPHIGHO2_01_FULL_41_14]|nr:MAG: 2-nitropropane dioxygenase [Alphaproteobacteria bacterium GWB1_45_5]OFW75851.1 MAG: 2-nitropropane dioxygenase [Alphaproteobacteria bacterium GWA1_45_9]OFW89939.1 MAG: 2-nitropropane dioxygenase [Alphaproteobacteria bacterium RIFCSPHIGHO2_01_FULL_41_14]HCI48379.1 2-nitropropane dioxygenase [Holosporales bacterium]
MQNRLNKLWKRGCDLLGSRYAILGGAMTWVSEPGLVAAISNAGGFGVLACGAMPPDILAEEIRKTRTLTKNTFGVNLILLHPLIEDLVKACMTEKVSHVVLAGGFPPASFLDMLKTAGIKVVAFAPSLMMAKKLIRMGIDGLVIEGMEAGGHIGPVSTTVLAQEILLHIQEVPVFVAGGIGRGEAIVSYLEMGASGCQLGTRFVCATECKAHPNFKQAFMRANARDAVASVQLDERFPVIPVRGLVNKGTEDFIKLQRQVIQRVDDGKVTLKEGQLEIEHYWAGALRRAVVEGDVERGSLMAGQSVGMVSKEQPVAEIIEELVTQSLSCLEQKKVS